MAAFKVITDATGNADEYEREGDYYNFNEHGLLVVVRPSTGQRWTYSPTGWLRLQDDCGMTGGAAS
jgi:hypothetical protein